MHTQKKAALFLLKTCKCPKPSLITSAKCAILPSKQRKPFSIPCKVAEIQQKQIKTWLRNGIL